MSFRSFRYLATSVPLCFWIALTSTPAIAAADNSNAKPDIRYARLTSDIYDQLSHRSDIPKKWEKDIAYGFSNPGDRREALVPLPDGALYVVSTGWTVVLVLLGSNGTFQDVQYFPAKGGFSVDWYQGLIITLHNHPGTGVFYHVSERVTVVNHKLQLQSTQPDWPAKYAD